MSKHKNKKIIKKKLYLGMGGVITVATGLQASIPAMAQTIPEIENLGTLNERNNEETHNLANDINSLENGFDRVSEPITYEPENTNNTETNDRIENSGNETNNLNTEVSRDTNRENISTETSNTERISNERENRMAVMGENDTVSIYPTGYGANADFLSNGSGTKEDPYVIDSVEDLRGLSKLVAEGETFEGRYFILTKSTYDLNNTWIPIGFSTTVDGTYTPFKGNITSKFKEGSTIRNLGFNGNASLVTSDQNALIKESEAVGFFGVTSGATISNIKIQTDGNTLEGNKYVGALVGKAIDTSIRNVSIKGKIKGKDYVGAVVGAMEASDTTVDARGNVIEDVEVDASVYISDHRTENGAVGGVVGQANNVLISDVTVSTNTGAGKHIYGNNAYVGGIVGMGINTDIYNSHVVSGEIGSSDSFAVGGIIGGYDKGQIKVSRFSGSIVQPTASNTYKAAFIGTTVNGAGFTYGEDGDIAYLYSDTSDKASFGIAGTRLSSENQFGTEAHIGYWHSSDNFYTIVNGTTTHIEDQKLFYEELEDGILNIKKTGHFTGETGDKKVNVNHYTCNEQGKPVRGYLLSVVDPTVNGNVAAKLTVQMSGSNNYKPIVTSEKLGAFKPGDKIYVSIDNQSNGNAYYRIDETKEQNPYYIYHKYDPSKFELNDYDNDDLEGLKENNSGKVEKRSVTNDGGYFITMPEADTVVSADFKAVANAVRITPDKVTFEVKQIRTGSRENPDIKWEVIAKDKTGNVITDDTGTRWIKEDGTGLVLTTGEDNPKFNLGSMINNNVNQSFNLIWTTENTAVRWANGTTKSSNIISVPSMMTSGQSEDKKSYIRLNVNDSVLNDYVTKEETKQRKNGYKDAITTVKPLVYTAMISAAARQTDASSMDTPATGLLPVEIKFSIEDKTRTSLTGASLNHNEIVYNVVRTLSGSRQNPRTEYTVNNESGTNALTTALHATFNPDYFSSNSVKWYLSDLETKDQGVTSDENKTDEGVLNVAVSGSGEFAYRDAIVNLKGISNDSTTNAFISPKVESQNETYTSQLKKVPDETFTYTKYVKVTAHDTNNNDKTDTAKVIVNFKTIDNTEIMPERVEIENKNNIHDYSIYYTFEGDRRSKVLSRTITMEDGIPSVLNQGIGQKISAVLSPNKDNNDNFYTPYNKEIYYEIGNPNPENGLNVTDVLAIDRNTGVITVRGYGESTDILNKEYSPWIADLISKGKLNGTSVKVRIIAKSARDNSVIDTKDINVTFKANTVDKSSEREDFTVRYTKTSNTAIAGTDIEEKYEINGLDKREIESNVTGSSEAPEFKVVDATGNEVKDLVEINNQNVTGSKRSAKISPKTLQKWQKDIIERRKENNIGIKEGIIKSQTANGVSVENIPVRVKFVYEGIDLEAKKLESKPNFELADKAETLDLEKGNVIDNEISLNVTAIQGNNTDHNHETRRWIMGVVGLENTVYDESGISKNTGIIEADDTLKKYINEDALKQGLLIPSKGLWKDVIDANKTDGKISGIIKVYKEINGKKVIDSKKVTINFRYKKAVLDKTEIEFNGEMSGGKFLPKKDGGFETKLNATIFDEDGLNVTPRWVSENENLVTVNNDGKVSLKPEYIEEIYRKLNSLYGKELNDYVASEKLQNYVNDGFEISFVKEVKITAINSLNGSTADTATVKIPVKHIRSRYWGSGSGSGSSSRGSGGSGGSGSGSGFGSRGVTTAGTIVGNVSNLPSYVQRGGQWTNSSTGQWYYTNGRTFTKEWAAVHNPYADKSKGQSDFDWFYFGEDSAMKTGWLIDNGETYYLNELSDNTKGRMFTGWNWIKGIDGKERCYYFEEASNGKRGSLYKNRQTPDGYMVNQNGAWTINGKEITR